MSSRSRRPLLRTLVLAACALLSFPATSAAGSEAASTVECLEIAFSDAAEGRDWAAFESLVHPEARFVGRGLARGPAEVTAAWRGAFDSDDASIRWRPRQVELLRSDIAFSRGPYRLTRRAEDGTVSESWGTFNSIWILDGDRWRVLFDLGSEGIEEGDRALLDAPDPDCSGAA